MKAITLRVLPSTATLPKRYKVSVAGRPPVTVEANHSIESTLHHVTFVVWGFAPCPLAIGQIQDQDYIAIMHEVKTSMSFVDMCGLCQTDSYLLIGTPEKIKAWCVAEEKNYGYMHYVITKTVTGSAATWTNRKIINLGV